MSLANYSLSKNCLVSNHIKMSNIQCHMRQSKIQCLPYSCLCFLCLPAALFTCSSEGKKLCWGFKVIPGKRTLSLPHMPVLGSHQTPSLSYGRKGSESCVFNSKMYQACIFPGGWTGGIREGKVSRPMLTVSHCLSRLWLNAKHGFLTQL